MAKETQMKRISNLRELQKVSIFIYKELREFCDENNLQVYLHGGTLIGAIRHQGFIPWDDDIDVCMSRTDYDALIKICGGKISEKCTLVDPIQEERFNGYIPVVVYNHSKMESGQYRDNEDLKIGISVFVYDGVPRSIIVQKLYFLHMYILRSKHALCRADFKHVNTSIAKLVGPFLQRFYHPKNSIKYKNKILHLQKKYNYERSKYVSTNADYKSSKEVCLKSEFEDAVPVVFEGIPSFTYSHYDRHLRTYYGDYMALPPKDQQKPKHSFNALIEDSFDYSE